MNTTEVKLGVNIDHIATLRQARGTRYPEPVLAALIAEQAGADLITVHLREDRRHIQERDVQMLQATLNTRLNLEMAVTEEMLAIATRVKPAECCLVPEKREELTTEGGLDVAGDTERIGNACRRLTDAGVQVSVFIDPDQTQLEGARDAGAPVVELHTGCYANASANRADKELARLIEAARIGSSLGLKVNAGHGLSYHNVEPVAAISAISVFNIGHAIVARAVFTGLDEAVREMKRLLREARRASVARA